MVRVLACRAKGRGFESRFPRLGYRQVERRRILISQRKGSIPFIPKYIFLFAKMSTFNYLENRTYVIMFICLFFSLAIASIILGLSFVIAIQRPYIEKTAAYECGFAPFEDARTRFDVRFYIVAILFLIFDIEVAFIFP